jgi:hypothetical protein
MTHPSEASARNNTVAPGSTSQAKKYTSSSHTASSKLACTGCHAYSLRRVKRKGVWQKLIASAFGYYPWECKVCREINMYRDRGTRARSGHKD